MAKYLVNNQKFVDDNVFVDYFQFNNLRNGVVGCLLGDYDSTGRYVISAEIKNELLKMKKHIAESFDNVEICTGELKLDKLITFIVSFEDNQAVLSVIEKLDYDANYKLQTNADNVNEFVLDVIETSGVVDKNQIYQKWNIDVFDGKVIDVFNCEESELNNYTNIVNKFKYLLYANIELFKHQAELETIEEELALSTLEILKRYPELKKKIDEYIKKQINEKKKLLLIDRPMFAKNFNEILQLAIQDSIDQLNEQQKNEFIVEIKNLINSINIKRTNIVELKKQILREAQEKGIDEEEIKLILMNLNIEDEDLNEVANQYVLYLKNGKLNPNFNIIQYLLAIGVLGVNIGYEVVVKTETIIAKAAEKLKQKNAKKEEGKDKKKDAKKDKKKDKKKDAKKDKKKEAKKDTKKDKKKEVKKSNLITQATTKPLIWFAAIGSNNSVPIPIPNPNKKSGEVKIAKGRDRISLGTTNTTENKQLNNVKNKKITKVIDVNNENDLSL